MKIPDMGTKAMATTTNHHSVEQLPDREIEVVVKITPIYSNPHGKTITARFFRQGIVFKSGRSFGKLDEQAFQATVTSYLESLSSKWIGARDFKIELLCHERKEKHLVCSTFLSGFRRDFDLQCKSIEMAVVSSALRETFDDMLEVHLEESEAGLHLAAS